MITLRDRVRSEFSDEINSPDKVYVLFKHHIIYHLAEKMNIRGVVISHIMNTSKSLTTLTVKKMRKDKNRMPSMEEEVEQRLQGHLPKHRRKYEFRRKY